MERCATTNAVGSQILKIHPQADDYEMLTLEEVNTCQTLRIFPNQYVGIKKTLLQAVAEYIPID